jgi:hypothetical protein
VVRASPETQLDYSNYVTISHIITYILLLLPCARNTDSVFRSSARRYMWCQVTITLHKITAAAREESILYDTRASRELISCTDPFSIIYFLFFFLSSSVTIFFSFYPVPCPIRELNWPRSRHLAIHVRIFKSRSRSNKTSIQNLVGHSDR